LPEPPGDGRTAARIALRRRRSRWTWLTADILRSSSRPLPATVRRAGPPSPGRVPSLPSPARVAGASCSGPAEPGAPRDSGRGRVAHHLDPLAGDGPRDGTL